MALFRKKRAEALEERATGLQLLGAAQSSALTSWSGASLTLDTALRQAAAWACITRLKSTITGLPVDVIRSQENKRTQLPTSQHPSIIRSPSPLVSRRNWIGQVVHSLTTAGFAAADVVDVDSQGRPLMLETINSSRVKPINGRLTVDGKPRDRWPLGDLWFISASHLMVDGTGWPMSPIEYGKESIATGLQAEKFGADFFRSGGMPVSVLKPNPVREMSREQIADAKEATRRATENRGILALAGWDIEGFTINPKDTQFIELLEFTLLEASRRWLVPPSMIFATMSGQNLTYSNITSDDLQYLKHGVQAWVVDLEDSWAEMLPGSLVAKFNVDALLRMDKTARTEEHKLRLETKTRTVNEVRKLEDEEPFDDPAYDQPGIPGSTTPPTGGQAA